MKFRSSALAITACALVLSACGGDSDAPAAKKAAPGPSLDDAKAVVIDYFTKAYVGDAAACESETDAYATFLNEQIGTADCTERIESIKEMLTDGEPFIDVSKTLVTMSEGEDGEAVADVVHEYEGFGGTLRLIVKDGAWLIDSEDEPAATGDGSDFTEPKQVSDEELAAIAEGYCNVEAGVTREEVEEWMGAPTAETVDADGQTELGWYVNKDSYTVWLDDSDVVSSTSGSSPNDDPCE